MKILLLLVILTVLGCEKEVNDTPILMENNKLAIMQSGTTDTETIITVLAPTMAELEFSVISNDIALDNSKHLLMTKKSMFDSPWTQYQLILTGLQLKINYKLKVKSKKGLWDDEREFSTLDTKVNKPLNFSVTSCTSDILNAVGNVMWPKLVEQNPDVLFMIGDNLYADIYQGVYLQIPANPKHLWLRHVETRNKLAIFRTKKLIPIYAIWDDHDYGKNNGDLTYKYKNESHKIFEIFFPHRGSSGVKQGPGVSFMLKLRQQNFVFFDNRSFRSPEKESFHFGMQQSSWFYTNMQKSKDEYFWLINGDQYFGGYHMFESFQGDHPKRFDVFLQYLRQLTPKKFFFISGDRHLFEEMTIPKDVLGYKTYELTTSGMHAFIKFNPQQLIKNKYRTEFIPNVYNFMQVKSSIKDQLNIDYDIIGTDGVMLSKKLELK